MTVAFVSVEVAEVEDAATVVGRVAVGDCQPGDGRGHSGVYGESLKFEDGPPPETVSTDAPGPSMVTDEPISSPRPG